jgi:hypothetical protein
MNTVRTKSEAGGLFRMSGETQMAFSFAPAASNAAAAILMAASLMCGAYAEEPALGAPPQVMPASGLSALACGNGGREAALTASQVKSGDRHYLEFRTRTYPGSPSGHLYVVFGELDASGKVVSRYHVGLAPDGLVIGFIGGALIEVPAHVTPRYMECSGGVIDAWRISISPAQYAAVTRRARASLLNPPLWSMFRYNCNHFAAGFGDIIGLKHPQSPNLTAALYLPAYIKANRR